MKKLFTLFFVIASFFGLSTRLSAQCYTPPTYCTNITAGNIGGYGMGLAVVNINSGAINNSTASGTGSPIYFDYTNLSFTTTASATVPFSITVGNSNQTTFRIYIDYNQDGTFNTTAPELVYTSPTTSASGVVTNNFTVPSGQPSGLYRLRIASDFTTAPNPCGPLTYSAEVEDYSMLIASASVDAMGVAHTSPNIFVVGNNSIGFSFRNLSSTPITTIDVGYQFESNTPVTQSLSVSVAAGAIYTHTFSTQLNIASIGSFGLKVWATNPNGAGSVTPVNDTICRSITTYCSGALSGTYTIDPAGSGATNFKRFGAADSALISCGVSGPVVFNVAAGTYVEQIDIPSITGASSVNTITFDGGVGNSVTRILTSAGGGLGSFTLRYNNCNWVTFQNLTVQNSNTAGAYVVHFLSGTNNRISNATIEFTGAAATSTNSSYTTIMLSGTAGGTGTSGTQNNIYIDSCNINAGYYGIYLAGGNGSNTQYFRFNNISNTLYYGIYVGASACIKFLNNTMNMRVSGGNTNAVGMYLINASASGSNFHEIRNNKILNAGQYAINLLTASGSGSSYGQIYNNFFAGFRNTSGYSGIQTTSSRWQIFNNSFNLNLNASSGSTAGISLTGGNLNEIRNNHIAITATTCVNAVAINASASSQISVLDNNNYFNASSSNLLFLGGPSFTFLNFKGIYPNGGGVNSINFNPSYVSTLDLHTSAACYKGVNLGITTDIDGDPRGSAPNIGADEVTTLPLRDIGIYKINNPGFPFAGGTINVNVTIVNYGSTTITNGTVGYIINGGTPVTATFTGTLNACDTLNFTFVPTASFNPGVNTFKAFTASPNGLSDLVLNNDTISTTVCNGLSGNYTIGAAPAPNNFATIGDAINQLNCGGVTGPVVFDIWPNTYNTQVTVGDVVGVSATNTITFQSSTGLAPSVTITLSSTSLPTLRLSGANWYRFKNLTISATNASFARAVEIVSNSSNDSFYNVVFNGITTTSTSQNYAVVFSPSGVSNNIVLDSCKINNGSYGTYFNSNSSAPSTENLTISNCIITNPYAYGMYNNYLMGLRLINNVITTNTTYTNYNGMYNYWVMMNTDANRPIISGNKVIGGAGGTGMYNYYIGVNSTVTVARRAFVANNMIQIGTGSNPAVGLRINYDNGCDVIHNTVNITTTNTSSSSSAIYYEGAYQTSAANVVERNIFASTTGAPATRWGTTNISGFSTLRQNNYHTTGAIFGYNNTTSVANLAAWQSAITSSIKDTGSVSIAPGFVAANDLHISSPSNIKNVPVHASVLRDIDNVVRCGAFTDLGCDHHPANGDVGVTRVLYPNQGVAGSGLQNIVVVITNFGATPVSGVTVKYKDNTTTYSTVFGGTLNQCDTAVVTFSGANAYTFSGAWSLKFFTESGTDPNQTNDTIAMSGCIGLQGTYTLGTGGTYATFATAIAAMTSCGIAGPVVFNIINPTTFNEQVTIPNIVGTSPTNTVTFDGGNGNAATRIVTFAATSSSATHTVRFSGSNYITIRNMTIRGTGTSYAWVVHYLNGTFNRVNNCIIEISGTGTTSTSSNFNPVVLNNSTSTVSSQSTTAHGNIVDSCTLNYGYASFYIAMNNAANTFTASRNILTEAYQYGVYVNGSCMPQIRNNKVSIRTSNTTNTSIYVSNCVNTQGNGIEISGNEITNPGQYGMYLTSCSKTGTDFSRIQNNMIYGHRYTSGVTGIYLSSVNNVQIYHNSVNLTPNSTGSNYACYIINGTLNDVRNNHFVLPNASMTNGISLYVNPSTAANFVNYNNYYNLSSPNVIQMGGTNYTLANYQTMGGGLNSIFTNPQYISATNLHTTAPCNKGVNLGVTVDFDGNTRSTPPDIGADEVSGLAAYDVSVNSITAPAFPLSAGTQSITISFSNNGGSAITSADFAYSVNGSTPVSQSWSGTLAPCQSTTLTFTTPFSFTGSSFLIRAYSTSPSNASDPNKGNDTTQVTLCPAMSGTYTIGASGPQNFATFADAVNALICGGVSGPVVFEVAPNTYTEQVTIPNIFGASATNTIRFDGGNGNAASCVLTFGTNATLVHVLRFNNSNYITFRNMTIRTTGSNDGWAAHFLDGSNNRVNNCVLEIGGSGFNSTASNMAPVVVNGSNSSMSTASTTSNNHTIDSCVLISGYYGVYATISNNLNTLNILNNTIEEPYQYGVYGINTFQLKMRGNSIDMLKNRTSWTTGNQAIYLQSLNNSGIAFFEVSGNKIIDAGTYGIYFNSCSNSGSGFNQVYNNMVGGSFKGTTGYGIYLTSCSRTQLYHNSVNLDMPIVSGTYAAAYINSGSTNDIRNNIFAVTSSSLATVYPLYLSSNTVATNLDYNNYYNKFGSNLLYIGGTSYNLSNYKVAFTAGGGANSISSDPQFVSATDLHTTNPCTNGASLGVALDFDGATRLSPPDLGADEVTNLATNDLAVLKVNAPAFPVVVGSQTINITIVNRGSSVITSATVGYSVNGGAPVTQSWSGSLAICDTANITFTTPYTFPFGSSLLKAFTNAPNGSSDGNASNDTLPVTVCPSLVGTFTIDSFGSGPNNFTSFKNAINNMICGGVAGPVIFQVAAGTYNEQVSIPAIPNTSAVNTITFDGGNGNAATRIVTFAGNSSFPATLQFNATSNIIVRNLTILGTGASNAWGVHIFNSTNCRLNNCIVELQGLATTSTSTNYEGVVMNGSLTSYSSSGSISTNNTIDSNIVRYGYYGIYTSLSTSTLINYYFNNTVLEAYQGGLYFNSSHTVKCNRNYVSMRTQNSTGGYGITLFNCNSTGTLFHEINNNVILNVGQYGIYMATSSGSGSDTAQVYNNMIGGGFRSTSASGIYTTSGRYKFYHNNINLDAASTGGACIYFPSTSNVNILRNNILSIPNSNSTGVYCIYIATTSAVNAVDYNNYHRNSGTNLLYIGGTTYTTATYKAAFTAGGGLNSISTNPGFVSNTDLHISDICMKGQPGLVATDIDGQTRNNPPNIGADELPINSLDVAVLAVRSPASLNVIAANPYTVTLTLRNYGTTTLTSVVGNYSINGTPTTQTFTSGSGLPVGGLLPCDTVQVSFTTSAVFGAGINVFKAYSGNVNGSADQNNLNDTVTTIYCTPFSGTFTINKNAPVSTTNFTSVNAAVAGLYGCGVTGPVVMQIVPGSGPYNEQVTFNGIIQGSSATNTITFKGGTNKEIITYGAAVSSTQHTIRLNGAKYITLDSLTINTTNISMGIGVHLVGGADSNVVSNCVINIAGTTASNRAGVAMSGTASPTSSGTNSGNFNQILKNTINGGYYGITAIGTSTTTFCFGNVISGNTLSGFYFYGTYFYYQDTMRVTRNTLSTTYVTTSTYGIRMDYCDRFDLSYNKVNSVGNYGIYLNYANYQNSIGMVRAKVYNNMVGGTFFSSSATGIYLNTNSRELDIWHNSVCLNNVSNGYAFFLQQTATGQYTGLDIRNNSFVTLNSSNYAAYFYYSPTSPFNFLDNNNCYNSNTTSVQVVVGTSGYTTNGWINQGGLNVNSKWGDPEYLNPANDLHAYGALLDNAGVNVGITDDIDGQGRPMSPSSTIDIGADEFNAILFVVNNPAAKCTPDSVNITTASITTGSSAGLTFTYWTDATATTALTNPTGITTGGTYYIKATDGATGYSFIKPVIVTINITPATPTITTPVVYCQGATASPLVATGITGNTINWYTTRTGGTPSTSIPTPSTATVGVFKYYVSQLSTNGCESPRDSITVTINATPNPPSVFASVSYCQFATASALTATASSGNSLLWYTVATGGTGVNTAPTPSTATVGATSYWVSQITPAGCESTRSQITVTINATPSAPTVSSPITYCQYSTSSALTATPATGNTLRWYTVATGGTFSTIAPTPNTSTLGSNTWYVSQIVPGTGCEGPRAAITVNVNPLPGAPTVSTPVSYCQGATASALTATPVSGNTLLWYTTATGGTGSATAPTPSTAVTGTINYYVSQLVGGVCEGPRALIAVITNPVPAAPSATSPITYCQNASASTLSATATSGNTLRWYTVATGGTFSTTAPTPSTASAGSTIYYVSQIATATSCESNRTAITVDVNPAPSAPSATSPVTYCQNATASALTATATTGNTLLWYTVATGGTGSTTAPTPSTSTAGNTNYYVSQVTTATGCEGSRTTIQVVVNPLPSAPGVTSPVVYCQNATASALTASAGTGNSLLWYTVSTGGTGNTSAPTPSTSTVGSTTWYVSQVTAAGCEGPRSPITVTINPIPGAPSATTTVTYCQNDIASALSATAGSGNALRWYTVATGGTATTVAPTPSTSTAGVTTYYVSQVITATGCEGSRTAITVTVNPTPAAPTVSTPVIYCQNATASALTATPSTGNTLKWYTVATGGTGSTTAPTPSTSIVGLTTYYVSQVIPGTGCEGPRAAIVVNVSLPPSAPGVTSPLTLCQFATASALTAVPTGGNTLLWYTTSTGGTGSSTAPTPSTATAGSTTWYVSQVFGGVCEGARAALTVVVNPSPPAPTVTSPITYCQGATATALTATPVSGNILRWYTVATGGSSSTVAPTPGTASSGTTNYYVSQVSTGNGCEGPRALIAVVVNPTPNAPIVNSAIAYCQGATASPLTATAGSGNTLYWYTIASGGTGSTTAPTPSTSTIGSTTWYVSQRTPLNCESQRAAITVTISVTPSAPGVVSPVNLCQNTTASPLTAAAASGNTLLWYTSATGGTGSSTAPSPNTSTVGSTTWWVSQVLGGNCEGPRASITVIVNPAPGTPTVTSPVSYCQNANTFPLTATASSGNSLLWYTTATGGTGSPTAPTPNSSSVGTVTYYVSQLSGSTGCESGRVPINVITNALPVAPSVSSPIVYCQNATAIPLSATAASGHTLMWYTSASGGTGSVTAPTPSTAIAGSTLYYVSQILTSTGCESPRTPITVGVNPTPLMPTVVSPVTYCQGATASALTATIASGNTRLWYTAATGGTGSTTAPTPGTSTAGTTTWYVSQINPGTGCESPRAALSVVINATPSAPTVTTPVTYCQGATASALTATASSGHNLMWYNLPTGGIGSSIAPTPSTASTGTTTWYVSQINTLTGCESSRASISIIINTLPSAPTVSSPVIYCQGASASALSATAASGNSLLWYTSATGGIGVPSITPTTATAGSTDYYVSQITTAGCESNRSLVTVVVNATASAPAVSSPVTYCQFAASTPLTATAAAGHSLRWYTVSIGGIGTTTAPTPSTTSAGSTTWYVSQVNNTTGCESGRSGLTVVVNASPAVPSVTTPLTYCQNASAVPLTASASSGNSLLWYTAASGGTGSVIAPTPLTTFTGSTTYYVSQVNTLSGCESQRTPLVVIVNPTPAAPSATSTVIYCQNATASALTATAASGNSLLWYSVATGGTGSATAPTPSTSTPGSTIWYVAQVNGLACESPRTPVTVIINALPSAPSVTSPVSYCQGATATPLTATATSGHSLLWYSSATGGTGSSITPTPSTAAVGTTTYYVSQVNNATGCEGSRSALSVVVNALPAAPSVATPVTYCQNATALPLSATPLAGNSLRWYTLAVGGTFSTTAPTPGTAIPGTSTFYVSQITAAGCEGSRAAITVIINPAPSAIIAGPQQVCANSPRLYSLSSVSGPVSGYNWSVTGGVISSGQGTPAVNVTWGPAGPGTLNCALSTTSGCNGAAPTYNVTINANPNPIISGSSSVCPGSILTYTSSSSGPKYNWYVSGGAILSSSGPAVTIQWGTAGPGTVTLTDSNSLGCTATVNYPVTINANPAPVITGPLAACTGSTQAYSATGSGSYSWAVTGGTPLTGSGSTLNITWTTAGVGTITILGTNGSCINTTVVNVNVNPTPTPSISGPATACTGTTVTYSVPHNAGRAYTWTVSAGGTITAGQGTSSITVSWNTAGANTLSVLENIIATGCNATSPNFNVTVTATPLSLITGSNSVCSGSTQVYTASSASTYNWSVIGGTISGSATSASVTIIWGAAGTGSVNLTSANGSCNTTNSRSVSITATPSPTIAGPLTVCSGSNNQYSVSWNASSTYTWTVTGGTLLLGQGTNSIIVNWGATGAGSVNLIETTTGSTCTATANAAVTINASPSLTVTGNTTVCQNSTETYTATGAITYIWSVVGGTPVTGSGSSITITWGTAGTGSITVVGSNGVCNSSSVTSISVNPAPSAVITGSGSVCTGTSGTYVVAPLTGGTYNWSVTGGVVTTGAGTNVISVTWGTTAGAGSISVTVTNPATSCSTTTTLPVSINATPNPNITGSTSVCQNTTQNYSITAIAGSAYTWSVTGGSITGGQGTNVITVSWPTAGSGSVSVIHATGACTGTGSIAVTVNAAPTTPDISRSGSILSTSATGTLQWNLNGSPIGGATSATHNAGGTAGVYTVTSTVSGCSSTSLPYTYVPTGVSNLSISGLNIYPNPTRGMFEVTGTLARTGKLNFRLTDAAGKEIFSSNEGEVSGNFSKMIDLSQFAYGVYLLEITTEEGTTVRRVVKQ